MSVRPAILVVDDDPEMLDLMDSLLSEGGYTVLTAENAVPQPPRSGLLS